jgi:molybdate transport system ATP-binding protein
MTMIVDVRQTFKSFVLDASFTSSGGVTALFGRSGSGKTSLVRAIAGLSNPQSGRIEIDGEVLLDTERGIFVPMHRRRFGYVFQEARLFPHLSVRQNLLYGRWFAPRAGQADNFAHVVELLGIGPLLDRGPGNLSGGEKQRVAIGRALLSSPRLLLMDEPLAALDDERKAEILPYLERLRDETAMPIVYVSHSVAEVARLSDRVVMMSDGRVEMTGTPSEVLSGSQLQSSERREAGVVLSGTVESIDPAHSLATVRLSSEVLVVPNAQAQVGQSVRLHIPERDVMLAIKRPEGLSALNILEGQIAQMDAEGEGVVRVTIRCGEDVVLARITGLSVQRLALEPGLPIYAVIKTVALAR